MPKKKIDSDRTDRYPELAKAVRYMERAPRIDVGSPGKPPRNKHQK